MEESGGSRAAQRPSNASDVSSWKCALIARFKCRSRWVVAVLLGDLHDRSGPGLMAMIHPELTPDPAPRVVIFRYPFAPAATTPKSIAPFPCPSHS